MSHQETFLLQYVCLVEIMLSIQTIKCGKRMESNFIKLRLSCYEEYSVPGYTLHVWQLENVARRGTIRQQIGS